MHDEGAVADLDSVWTGVQVDTLVQIDVSSQPDMVCEPQAYTAFDGRRALHVQDQAIENPSNSDPHHRGNPADECIQALFQDVTPQATGLAMDIQLESGNEIISVRFRKSRHRSKEPGGYEGEMVNGSLPNGSPPFVGLRRSRHCFCACSAARVVNTRELTYNSVCPGIRSVRLLGYNGCPFGKICWIRLALRIRIPQKTTCWNGLSVV